MTLECYLAVPALFWGITRYNLQSRPFYFHPSRDIVRVELRSLFYDLPFETWLRDLPESGHNMLSRVSHLEIQNVYTHLPPQELVESMVSLPVRGDFTENGRGALKYFTGLKRLTICPGPQEYPRNWRDVPKRYTNVTLVSAELKAELAARFVKYFKEAGINVGLAKFQRLSLRTDCRKCSC
jgi:hypothetical protein